MPFFLYRTGFVWAYGPRYQKNNLTLVGKCRIL